MGEGVPSWLLEIGVGRGEVAELGVGLDLGVGVGLGVGVASGPTWMVVVSLVEPLSQM